ncbi:MAG: prepilin-type N-terminal cleavage/methylation domain-containing protein [Desulfobulbus sp.]|nr:prepilin-type N-terminal cleavage/methylation domain-containing protein [Desulfobulbus sp.]
MTRHRSLHDRNQGFSLVELAIVLIIFTLLAGGLLMTLSAQQEIQRLNQVRRQLADIREALLGYAVANGRLPAPANPAIASGAANAGVSDNSLVTGAKPTGMGVLPWATLGLPETDPWGQRFTYRVTPSFADAIGTPPLPSCPPNPPPAQASFALCSNGDITVTDGSTNIATNLPVIVISHGRNGLGGYGQDGTQRAGAAGYELTNATGSAIGCSGVCFVSRVQSADFDDEVIWVPLPILMNRMVIAGRLP